MRALLKFKYKIILLVLGFILLFLLSWFYEQRIFDIHFVDEEHNIVLGSFLLKGERMYSDIFNNHQPLAHIISAGIQKITDPNSIYLLIKRHREFMILWTLIWAVILFRKFSFRVVPFFIFYELTKTLLLGNLFLSESLIVYPLIYTVGLLLEKKIEKKEYPFAGFIFALITFTLLPVWPLLLVTFVILMVKSLHLDLKRYFLIFTGFLPVLVLVLWFSSIKDYFFDVFYINFKYFIPYGTENGTDGASLLSFITPLVSFFTANSSRSLIIIQLSSLLLIVYLIVLIRQKKVLVAMLVIVTLGLANIRYIQPGQEIYRGFHLLPWYALLLFFISYLSIYLIKNINRINIFAIVILVLITIQSFLIAKDNLFKKIDFQENLYINYSPQFDNGIIVKSIKTDEETMLVSPDEWLIYWQADVRHPKKIVNFYEWMARSPELRSMTDDLFAQNPPTYVYCNCQSDDYLMQYLGDYSQTEKFGSKIPLYIRKEKLQSLTPEQTEKLKFYGVEI